MPSALDMDFSLPIVIVIILMIMRMIIVISASDPLRMNPKNMLTFCTNGILSHRRRCICREDFSRASRASGTSNMPRL